MPSAPFRFLGSSGALDAAHPYERTAAATQVERMKVLDLFSGIGGFSLGLERAGMQTAAFCESDPYCRLVLDKHWPEVPIYDDVRTLTAARLADAGIAVDVICGGPPCQPNSSAARGRSRGQGDPRFLWWEACRLVRELGPTWFVFENVVNFDSVGLEPVVSHLEASGYQIGAPLEIPACAVGLDHRRPRLWICGHSNRDRKPRLPVDAKVAWVPRRRSDADRSREANGLPRGLDAYRRSALGNAVTPQIPEAIGRAIMSAESAA